MLQENESLSEKFVKRGFWLYFFTILGGPIGYIIKALISRDLSVDEVGMIYGVISFVTVLSMYNDLGCTESLQYYLPKYIVKKDYGRAKYLLFIVFGAQLITSITIYFLLFFFAPWLADHYFHADVGHILRVAGLFFIGINLMHIAIAVFGAAQDMKLAKGSEFLRLSSTGIGVAILFFSDLGTIERYMAIWVMGLGIGVIFALISMYRRYYKPYFIGVKVVVDTTLRRQFIKYSLATFLSANVSTMLSQIDMQLIIALLSQKDVGYYSNYLSIIGIPYIVITPIITLLFPVVSELSGRNQKGKIQSLTSYFWLLFSILGIWTGFFMYQFGSILAVFFFGEKFRFSGEIVQYSSPFLVFNFLSQIAFQVLAGTGEAMRRTRILLIVLVINISLNLLLIPPLGVKGSALAVGISWIPLFFLAQRATKIPYDFFRKRQFLGNLLAAGTAFFLSSLLIGKGFPYFLDILLALFIYLSIFLASNIGLMREVWTTVKNVKKTS